MRFIVYIILLYAQLVDINYAQNENRISKFNDKFEKPHYVLSQFDDSIYCPEVVIHNMDSSKELNFSNSKINSKIKFENSFLNSIKIYISDLRAKLIFENVSLANNSLIQDSKLSCLVLSNLKGKSLIINNSVVDTLYVLVEPNNPDPTIIEVNDCQIHYLKIVSDRYFSKIPDIKFYAVQFNVLCIKASFIGNNVDFGLSYFEPDIIIDNYDYYNNELNSFNNRQYLLSMIGLQYKKHGNYKDFLAFKTKTRENQVEYYSGISYIIQLIIYKYYGGEYFSDIKTILFSLIITSFIFSIIYFFLGLKTPFGKVYRANASGHFEDANKEEYSIYFPDYKKSKKGLYTYYLDCLLFTINHFFSLRSDKTFTFTLFFSKRPNLYVSYRRGKLFTFIQFIIGLWCLYSLAMCFYNYFQSS